MYGLILLLVWSRKYRDGLILLLVWSRKYRDGLILLLVWSRKWGRVGTAEIRILARFLIRNV